MKRDRKRPGDPKRFAPVPGPAGVARLVVGRLGLGVVVGWVVVASTVAPSAAWALCPNCLGQARSLTPTMELLGVFLLVPFVVFIVVWRAIRRASRL